MDDQRRTITIERVFGSARMVQERTENLRRYGVPPGGPFDSHAFGLLKGLQRLPDSAFLIELSGAALDLVVGEPCSLVQFGARMNWSLDGIPLAADVIHITRPGRLCLQGPASGWTTYLSVPGGWPAAQNLTPGTTLDGSLASGREIAWRREGVTSSLRVTPCLYHDEAPDQLSGFRTVSLKSNRRGIILEAEGQQPSGLESIESVPVDVGLVQLTPDGTLIIVGPDGPTIGGYPPVASVIAADLHLLGQLRPGTLLRMELVTSNAAKAAYVERQEEFGRRLASLRRLVADS
ncbi:MAG: hypothetical protein HONBIEJF_02110 [Fimbriimonadaceae bacterium]|nr:hypothetical protein [Fimbriimonadaceae bacterium]